MELSSTMKLRKFSGRNHEAHCGRSDGVRWNGGHSTEFETARHHISGRTLQDPYIAVTAAQRGSECIEIAKCHLIVKDYGASRLSG